LYLYYSINREKKQPLSQKNRCKKLFFTDFSSFFIDYSNLIMDFSNIFMDLSFQKAPNSAIILCGTGLFKIFFSLLLIF